MIIIRPAFEQDRRYIYDFICQLEEEKFDYQIFEQGFIDNLSDDRNIYLLAEEDDNVAGFLGCHSQFLLHHNDWVYEIHELFVDEKSRGKKIGEQLISKLENMIRTRGHRFIDVTSNAGRANAHRFYLRHEYKQTHVKFTKKLHT